jgi:hypothetical protein
MNRTRALKKEYKQIKKEIKRARKNNVKMLTFQAMFSNAIAELLESEFYNVTIEKDSLFSYVVVDLNEQETFEF